MAKFEKGHKKYGGRAKGTPNKRRTIFESLEEIVTEDGKPVDVVKMFFAALMQQPPYQQVDALLEFMQFVYPKQKENKHEITGLLGTAQTTEPIKYQEIENLILEKENWEK